MIATAIKAELDAVSNKDKSEILQRFFKTGPGQYGEGDIFWGIQIPTLRSIIKRYKGTPLDEIVILLHDPVHEIRVAGAMLMVEYFKKGKPEDKKECFDCYIKYATCFNNWDLVDLTCHHIVGGWLWDKDRTQLYEFAKSGNLWKERISIVSTYYFLRKKDFDDTFGISTLLLNHKHDLIHKAVGWMIREVGNRDHVAETNYLLEDNRYQRMPRTMLRYAIEKFPDDERLIFMKK